MADYIDRAGLVFDLKTSFVPQSLTYTEAVGIAIRWIEQAPAADVVEVKHGRWDERNIYICTSDGEPVACIGREYKCSECGRTENKQEPYCHCGAKMDGE